LFKQKQKNSNLTTGVCFGLARSRAVNVHLSGVCFSLAYASSSLAVKGCTWVGVCVLSLALRYLACG